jgi:hypothetical protein
MGLTARLLAYTERGPWQRPPGSAKGLFLATLDKIKNTKPPALTMRRLPPTPPTRPLSLITYADELTVLPIAVRAVRKSESLRGESHGYRKCDTS